MEKVTVWVEKNINGRYFVEGSYFWMEKKGDIESDRPYTQNELIFKKEIDKMTNLPLIQIENKIKRLASVLKFQPIIEVGK